MSLPLSIRAKAEFTPIEDILLPILRADLPDVRVQSLIEEGQDFPLVLVRRVPQMGFYSGDPRFTDVANVVVHTFCEGINADEEAAVLAEAVRVVLRDVGLHKRGVPGRGAISYVDMTFAPRRVTDWATSVGPVQYADLPTGVFRYETQYEIEVRKPFTRSP